MKIRDATPEDAGFLAWVQLTAARSHLSYGPLDHILGLPEAETLAFLTKLCVTEPVSWHHQSRFLIAEVDGEPAAALCGYDPQVHGDDNLNAAWGATLMQEETGADLAGLASRAAAIGTCMAESVEGAWVVENVATRPKFRGRGLVQDLLGAALERGREQGFKRGQISVLIGNETARRAYIRAGFQPDLEKRHPDFAAAIECPGIERLLQDL